MNQQVSLQGAFKQGMMAARNNGKAPADPINDDLVLVRMIANRRKGSELDGSAVNMAASNKRPRLDGESGASPVSASLKNNKNITTTTTTTTTQLKSPLLHQTCRLFAKCAPVIESALEMENPEAACKRAECARKGNNSSFIVGDTKVPYSLPINILLHEDASVDAIKLMAEKAPKALLMKDGRDECCALIIALRLYGCRRSIPKNEQEEEEVVVDDGTVPLTVPEVILAANPTAAQHHDKKRNFPLHVAAYVGSSSSIINKLYYAYPDALLENNFYGETPLDICIRNGKCSELSCNFLQEKLNHLKLARLRSMKPPQP